jgi:Phosphotransferase enzyme family
VSTSLGGTPTMVDLSSRAKSSDSSPARHGTQYLSRRVCHKDFLDGNLLVRAAVTRVSIGVIDLERASSTIPWLTSPKRFAMPQSISQAAPRS